MKENFTNAYGLTETHGVATRERRQGPGRTRQLDRSPAADPRHAGRRPGRAIRSATASSARLQIYGPTITPGYWNRPEATAETVVEGWLRTGDLGTRDAEGFFFIADRAKDMIIRGGENVYCTEIENVLADPSRDRRGLRDRRAGPGARRAREGDRLPACRARSSTRTRCSVTSRRTWRTSRCRTSWSSRTRPLPRNPAGKLLKNVFRGTGAVPFQTDDLD